MAKAKAKQKWVGALKRAVICCFFKTETPASLPAFLLVVNR